MVEKTLQLFVRGGSRWLWVPPESSTQFSSQGICCSNLQCPTAKTPSIIFPYPLHARVVAGTGLTLPIFYRVVDFLLKAIMRTMWFAGGFHRVAVKGRQALPTEAAILTLAPHSSYFDAIPVTMTMSSIVMKAESRDIPIWGSE